MSKKERIVIIGIDGSKYSEQAFSWYSANYAQRNRDSVLLFHSICPSSAVSTPVLKGVPISPEKEYCSQLKRMQQESNELEKKFMDRCKAEGLRCKWESSVGDAGLNLVHFAQKQSADLIVVGKRGLNLFRRTLVGSVSNYVAHHIDVPVLIIPTISNS